MKQGPVVEAGEASTIATPTQNVNRAISIVDIISRFLAVIGALGSAVAMGTTNQTLTFLPQFILLRAQYNDLPTLTFFVIANAVASGFLFLSLPISVFNIIRSTAKITRIILILIDTAMLALLTAGASAAVAIVYLAHKGNTSANWPSICQQLDTFCERISGSLMGSFAAIIALMLIIVTSAVALSRS